MKIAYFDTISGISGDMILGAFINAGLPLSVVVSELEKLDLRGYEIIERKITRSMLTATKIDVTINETAIHQDHDTHHGRRSYMSIVRMIDQSRMSGKVKETAKAIFLTIGKAEAKIHDTTIDKVHFHEIGAVDSIVDIVGIAICLEKLGIEEVFSSVVKTGSGGFIQTDHGMMPIPTPATLEILKDYPIELTNAPYELTTPTGAGVLATLSKGILKEKQQFSVETIGYGAGGREIPQMPNLLRVMIGNLPDPYIEDNLFLLETNIDDMNPELYPYVIERLIDEGAHDAYVIPIIMKKGRPGYLLATLASTAMMEQLIRVIYSETTTTGIRIQEISRKKLERDVKIIESRFGPVAVKFVQYGDRTTRIPEYDECKRIAREQNIPLIEVYKQLERDL